MAKSRAAACRTITGGLPLLCARWPKKADVWTFLSEQLTDPLSPLLVSGERTIAAEFPGDGMARSVLQAIGHGERHYRNIIQAAGISSGTLAKAIEILTGKRMVAAELPVSLTPSKERRYRVTDPYLRFWFTFVRPHLAEIERGRGDLTIERVRVGWTPGAAGRSSPTEEPLPLIAVSRSGIDCEGLAATFGPAELIAGWKRRI